MMKKTLYFGNQCNLSLGLGQLCIAKIDEAENRTVKIKSIHIEDIGVVVLDSPRVTITSGAMNALLSNNVAVICCNDKHMPNGLMLPLEGNYIQSEKFKWQIEASEPLKKQLWQQIITAKITNQAEHLKVLGIPDARLARLATEVRSGDTDNREAIAAAHYWPKVFTPWLQGFRRDRSGLPPNQLLNYGYAILRAMTARALVESGLLCTLGVFHKNRYNAYALADDLMEPYRPFVDFIVRRLLDAHTSQTLSDELGLDLKKQLLSIATFDVDIDGHSSPLMVAIQRSAQSMAKCFEGSTRKLILPKWDL